MAELLAELTQEQPKEEEPRQTVQPTSEGTYNFAALTAFTENDPEASRTILESFTTETRLNRERMEQALDKADMKEAAAVAHKMIPLFVLLEAHRLVAVLRELEAAADAPFSAEWEEKIRTILTLTAKVLENVPS